MIPGMRISLAILVVGLLLGGFCGWYFTAHGARAPQFDVPFQAVLLDSGQVYFGKISGLGTPYPVVRDVYYIQSNPPRTRKPNR